MSSARQLNKDHGLRLAAGLQKRGTGGTTDLPQSSGNKTSSSFPYEKEEMVISLGEHFYNTIMVLAQQAARSTSDSSFRDIADGIFKDASHYISKASQMKAFALLMYHYGLEDIGNVETSAKLCAQLSSLEAGGIKFRSPLLKQLQEDFTTRARWKESAPSRWLALCCYLCCLFRHLKIGEQYVSALVEPVFTCLDSIFSDDASDREIECACNQIKELGPILEDINPSQMDVLIAVMREKLLGSRASHLLRLLLLELIELRASGWKLTDTQRQYYSVVIC